MSTQNILDLILQTLSQYGQYVFIIISSTLAIGVAYLLFRFGWHNLRYMITHKQGKDWYIDDLPRRGEKYGVEDKRYILWKLKQQ